MVSHSAGVFAENAGLIKGEINSKMSLYIIKILNQRQPRLISELMRILPREEAIRKNCSYVERTPEL